MRTIRKHSGIAMATLLVLAAWTSNASAGHLNVVLKAQLEGSEEVASGTMTGAPNGRADAYVFGVDGDTTTLCYLIADVKNVEELSQAPGNGRAAHIHEGTCGSNGAVVVNLAWPQDGQAADCLTEGKPGKFPTNEAGIVQRILKNPTDFYINVHNTAYPAGAIRGQLRGH